MAPITVNYLIMEIRIWSRTKLAMINAKSTKSFLPAWKYAQIYTQTQSHILPCFNLRSLSLFPVFIPFFVFCLPINIQLKVQERGADARIATADSSRFFSPFLSLPS